MGKGTIYRMASLQSKDLIVQSQQMVEIFCIVQGANNMRLRLGGRIGSNILWCYTPLIHCFWIDLFAFVLGSAALTVLEIDLLRRLKRTYCDLTVYHS